MKSGWPLLRGAKPNDASQVLSMTDNRKKVETLKQELAAARSDANRNALPQVGNRQLDVLRAEFRNQISDTRRGIRGAYGRNAPQANVMSAKSVRTADEKQPQASEPRTSCNGRCTN